MANIQEAIEYAKKNPTSSFANELKRRIESGQMNNELKSAGLTQYLAPEEPGLGSQLAERGKTLGRELLSIGTLGASTLSKQDVQEARQSPEQAGLVAMQAFNRAFQSPIRAAGAVAGAGADILGAGLEATGIPQAIAPVVAPILQSKPAQQVASGFKALPEETQQVLGDIGNVAGAIPVGAGARAVKSTIGKVADISALDAIKGSSGNLTQKALDFISADPEKKVATILKESTPEQLDNYLAIAEKAASDPRIATPFEVVGNKLSDTTKILETRLKDIGARKSAIIEPMREGLGAFKKETTPLIQKLTSLKNSFTEIDASNKSKVQAIINDAKTIATKKDADAFIDKVQDALYKGNKDMTIPVGSSLDKQLRGIIGEYNTSLKNSLPEEYGALNKQYSELIDSLDVINRSLGEVVEGVPVRGASLIKQFFSPSGTKAKEIFEFVKKETNGEIDLAKDATLAKFSMDLFDDPRSRSLLAGIGDIPTSVGGVVTKVAERLGGDKLQEAMRGSTIRKAKEISSPKSATESYSAPKVQLKSESPSSLNSTPETKKDKGIRLNRGSLSLNPEDWFEQVANSAEVGLKAKTKELQLDMAKEAARTMRNNGVSVEVPNPKNAVEILKQAKELARKKKVSDIIKSETPSDKMKPFLEPKKKVTDSLEQEAKGKTLEEFIKAQGTPLFHGTQANFSKFKTGAGETGEGVYFYPEKRMAEDYSGDKGRVIEAYVRGKFATIEDFFRVKNEIKDNGSWTSEKTIEALKKKGYVGVHRSEMSGKDTYSVFDPKDIKTKDELIEIYKKSKK